VGSILSVGIAGCSSLPAALGGPGEAGRQVELKPAPVPGMRVSYQVRTVATVAGPGVRALPDSQKSATVSQRYVLEVTAVSRASFEVRITGDAFPGVVTARFAPNWTALRFGVETEGRYADADLATFPVLGEAFQLERDLSGRWAIGETRPWGRVVNFPPLVRVRMRGTATLKKIASRDGRRAAEFHYTATGEGEYATSVFRMSLSGQSWVDLATGFLIETRTSAPGQFTPSSGPVQIEIKEDRTLDRSESRGF
jgi:hypothetical protein